MKRYETGLIKQPRRDDDILRHKDGNTGDIIETVLFADKRSAVYTKEFAATLKGSSIIETCRNIWAFVKTQIPYVLDKRGYQWVKSPGRLWADQEGDCKSFSVFIASCLQNLGIPYGFRFVSYKTNDTTATHVYVIVPHNGREIILDSVWDGPFNTQKQYTFKKDFMSEVHYLGDVGRSKKKKKMLNVAKHLLFPSPSTLLFGKLFSKRRRRHQAQLAPLPFPQGGQYPVPAALTPTAVIPPAIPVPQEPVPVALPRVVVTGTGN